MQGLLRQCHLVNSLSCQLIMLKECCAYLFVLPSTSYLLTSLLLALPIDKCGKWLCPSTGQLTNLSTKKVNGMTWRLTCQLVYSGFVLFSHEF